MLATVPAWYFERQDESRYLLSVPLSIENVVQEGLYLDAKCRRDAPDIDVSFTLTYNRKPQLAMATSFLTTRSRTASDTGCYSQRSQSSNDKAQRTPHVKSARPQGVNPAVSPNRKLQLYRLAISTCAAPVVGEIKVRGKVKALPRWNGG
jgi:hypothetical protein